MSEIAIFAAGSASRLASAFKAVDGVLTVTTGYCGGHTGDPTPASVAAGRTGHAESVRVEYDPDVVYYEELLEVFLDAHDPTNADLGSRSGPRRSIIFTANHEQVEAAQNALHAARASGRYVREVVTQIRPAGEFFPVELS
jgi:peptide-methionine (S)-S-oxide reductase